MLLWQCNSNFRFKRVQTMLMVIPLGHIVLAAGAMQD
jgi:hypothetical protein